MIRTHVGWRLLEAAAGIDSIADVVAYTTAIDPMPFLTSVHFRFPLLAVYRRGGRLEDRTVGWRHGVGRFEIMYVFPPLTAAEGERFGGWRKRPWPIVALAPRIYRYENASVWINGQPLGGVVAVRATRAPLQSSDARKEGT